MWKLSSQTRIEPILPALEGKVVTTGWPGKNPELILRNRYIRQILSRVLDARDAILQKKKRGKKQTLRLFLNSKQASVAEVETVTECIEPSSDFDVQLT